MFKLPNILPLLLPVELLKMLFIVHPAAFLDLILDLGDRVVKKGASTLKLTGAVYHSSHIKLFTKRNGIEIVKNQLLVKLVVCVS